MSGIGIGAHARGGIEHGVEERQYISVRASSAASDCRDCPAPRRGGRRLGVDTGCGHHERHDQRRPEAVVRDVAEHDAHAIAVQPEQIVEVAAHRIGRQAAGRHLGVAQHRWRGEQLELEVVGQLELAAHPLLPEVARHQPGVLDGRPDLVGDRGHQFAVAGGEQIRTVPVGEIDDADRPRLVARRAIHIGTVRNACPR